MLMRKSIRNSWVGGGGESSKCACNQISMKSNHMDSVKVFNITILTFLILYTFRLVKTL